MPVRSSHVAVLLLGLAAAMPARADEPAQTSPIPPSDKHETLREARFMSYVLDGDEARAAGKLGAAARAYASALEVRDDPVVAGRLGLIFMKMNRPADAADLLLEGVERGFEGVSKAERQSFFDAYEIAKREVTWLNITISNAGAKLMLDGVPKNENGYSALTIFVMPGEHELIATLDEHEDAIFTFTAIKGTERNVTLTLKPTRPLLAKPETLRRRVRDRIVSVEDPPEDEPEKPEPVRGGVEGAPQAEKPRITVMGGPVLVFGVASWQPAVGPVAGVAWRPKEYFSVGIEGRAAWVTSGLEGGQINAMTAGGIASACLHWRWLFGCGLGHLGVISLDAQATSYRAKTDTFVKPGIGGRIGVSGRLTRGFVLGGTFDVLGLNSGIKVLVGQTVLVDHPPVMLGGHVIGGWEF